MAVTKIRDEQAAQSVSLTTEVTGTLPVGNGGIGQTSLTNLPLLDPILGQQASPTYTRGKLVYDTTNECLTFYNNESAVANQLGQETWVRVRNVTGSTIGNGVPVYINGTDSSLPSIAPAQANAWNTAVAVGLTTMSIPTATTGYVTVDGFVRSLNTSSFTAGQLLYVSAAAAGALVNTAPIWPNYQSVVGRVVVSNASTGIIHVLQTQPSAAPLGPTTINAPGATPTVNWTLYNDITYTGIAAAITSMTTGLTAGTPTHSQKLLLAFKDNGTARAIAWGASYQSSGVATLPTTTVVNKMHLVGLRYDSTVSKWVCISVDATGY